MSRWAKIRSALCKLCFAITLMIAGAEMLVWYLIHTEPQLSETLRQMQSDLSLLFIIFLSIGASLIQQDTGGEYRDITPRHSGVAVVLITGGVAFIALAPGNYLHGLLIAIGTIAAAAAVWRFATRHAGEIGEARFLGRHAGE